MKVAAGLIVLILIAYGFYLYKLHALAVEGNNLFALRCTDTNLPLIDYKYSFLHYANALNNPGKYTPDEIKGFFNDYILGMRKYVVEENKWLEKDNKFINRWDFKLIEPWYIKQAGYLQWKMYEAYRDDAQYLLDIEDHKIPVSQVSGISEARRRRDKYVQEYFDFYTKAVKINDWRKYFGYVLPPKVCTIENTTIPNTSGSLDMGGDSATPSSEQVPIDPFGLI